MLGTYILYFSCPFRAEINTRTGWLAGWLANRRTGFMLNQEDWSDWLAGWLRLSELFYPRVTPADFLLRSVFWLVEKKQLANDMSERN